MLPAETLTDRIVGALTCAAFDHRVGGILFLDLPPDLLDGLARWLAAALPAGAARIETLRADDNDDTLWVSTDTGYAPAPGRLHEPPGTTLIAVVPDLARANLAVTRAATVLIGADGAVTDRHGFHTAWRPRGRWLAACPAADAERLSPHLLDRFPVRVAAAGFATARRTPAEVLAELDRATTGRLPAMPRPAVPAGPPPALSTAAAELVIGIVGAHDAPHRRDLALARVSRVVAASDRAGTVGARHVRRAAELLGFHRPEPATPGPVPGSEPEPESGQAGEAPIGPLPEASAESPIGGAAGFTGGPDPGAEAAETVDVVLPGVPVRAEPPYPEDQPNALPDFASLGLPWRRSGGKRSTRGPIIGAEPSGRPVDIAYLATVLEAAKYQRIRYGPGTPLRIHATDLWSYRRRPLPESALVLLLDHTSRRDWDVAEALAPYLGWAYTRRAAVSLVEIGHREAESELRAERRRLSGVLDPLLDVAFDHTPARATPLAHGLDLALQEMRVQRRNLRLRDGEAWLVVVSDARGNVPLESSQRDVPPRSAGRAGVDDALTVAAGVAALRAVRPVVLAPPELSFYRDLPFALADAMSGMVARPEGDR